MVFTPNMQPKEHAIGTTKGGGYASLSFSYIYLVMWLIIFMSRMYDLKNPFIAEIVVNRELHGPSSDRSCRHIEFAVGTDLKYVSFTLESAL
jgi:sulfite reductase alpha subunit-like flavoprotein